MAGVLVTNVAIAFSFVIKEMVGTPPTNVSLITTAPDGTSTFDASGTTIGAVYTAPTTLLTGTYDFTKTFTTGGTWKFTLVDGTASSYTVLHERLLTVTAGDTAFVSNITFE